MSNESPAPIQVPAERELMRAVELVSAAYRDAMTKHGIFPGTIKTISHDAYVILVSALSASPDEGGSTLQEGGGA